MAPIHSIPQRAATLSRTESTDLENNFGKAICHIAGASVGEYVGTSVEAAEAWVGATEGE